MKQLLINTALAIAAVFMPIKGTLLVVMLLTVVDLVSGLLAARHRKEPLTSSGLKRTVIKVCVYEIAVMLGFLTEQYLTGDMLPVVKILAGYIGITELKSVLENMQEITGIDLLKALVDKISSTYK